MEQEEMNQNTNEGKKQQLISIQEIASPDLKSQESQNGFVSLDINELEQTSQITGKIEAEKKEIELEEKDTIIANPDDKTIKNEGEIANWPHPEYAAYLYHDIELEIPQEMKFLVKTGYRTWKLTTFGYFINLITIACAAFNDNYYQSGLEQSEAVFTSLLWTIIATPLGFLLWYMNLYRIANKFSTKNWLVFYVTFACHMLFTVIILSGCPWYPCAGVFFTITCIFQRHVVTTILSVINCIIWSIVLILSMAIFNSVKQMFNTEDTTKEVKGDFKNTLAKIVSFAM